MSDLPKGIPFIDVWLEFIEEYQGCTTYWYIPKARTVNNELLSDTRIVLHILFERFLDKTWDTGTQDEILQALVEVKVLDPYILDGKRTDRTALVRIWKKLLETLGLVWVQEGKEIIITDAGLDFLASDDDDRAFEVIEEQIAKYQFPNPSMTASYNNDFRGILPHLFLLQLFDSCDGKISVDEFDLFVNLAQCQDDLPRICKYILHWRDLGEEEKDIIQKVVKAIKIKEATNQLSLELDDDKEAGPLRHTRISLNSSYQRAFFSFPRYIAIENSNIISVAPDKVKEIINDRIEQLKISEFDTLEEWFAYYGNPNQQPSWFTYLVEQVEKATTQEEVEEVIEQLADKLSEEEVKEIERKQIEKGIETFYVDRLDQLEPGLKLVDRGRQFPTPIGRIDLLCQNKDEIVVVEIKTEEAKDSVFGQILRYMGWVHRNFEGGQEKVRGIILAGQFPESARYSRIGLMRGDYKEFLGFKQHGLDLKEM